MKNSIVNGIISIIAGVLGYSLYFVMAIVGYVLVALGRASKYTNCTYVNGTRLNMTNYIQKFGIDREAVLMKTDQGNLVTVHGVAEGSYLVGAEIIGEYKLAKMFPVGDYIVSSCGNGMHEDFAIDGKRFIRDTNTISDFCSIMIATPWGTLITFGHKAISVYSAIINGTQYWKLIPSIIAHEDKSAKRYAEMSK